LKYKIEKHGGFLVVKIIGNMTSIDETNALSKAINDKISGGKNHKILFNLEKVEDIDDDGIDVFINCLSQQSFGVEDKDILWAQNLDESKIEKEIMKSLNSAGSANSEFDEDDEDGSFNLSDIYKEVPNAPQTDCFVLVKDDDVYDKLHEAGVSGLMTIYRTREDFTSDQGVKLAD